MSEKVFSPLNKIQYLIVQKFIFFAKNYLPVLNCTKLIFLIFWRMGQLTGAKVEIARSTGRVMYSTVHCTGTRTVQYLYEVLYDVC